MHQLYVIINSIQLLHDHQLAIAIYIDSMHAAELEQGGQSVKDLTVKIASYIAIQLLIFILMIATNCCRRSGIKINSVYSHSLHARMYLYIYIYIYIYIDFSVVDLHVSQLNPMHICMHACLTGFWNLMCMAFLNKYNGKLPSHILKATTW